MNDALILAHHEFIDPNIWFPHESTSEPRLIIVHNERGIFGWTRPRARGSLCWGLGFNDWMAICRECGRLSKVDKGHLCGDHFMRKLESELRKLILEKPEQYPSDLVSHVKDLSKV